MFHESLPTYEKLNILVLIEQYTNETKNSTYYFYTDKYEKYTNNGFCLCCNNTEETIEHLFAHCSHTDIQNLWDNILNQIYTVLKQRLKDDININISPDFYISQNINIELDEN